jgi:hypothetical protein
MLGILIVDDNTKLDDYLVSAFALAVSAQGLAL